MKKKEKDDVMGEDVSSLPEAKSMLWYCPLASQADFWPSTMRESDLRLTTCMVLSAPDEECGRASYVFLQVYQVQQAVEDILSVWYCLNQSSDFISNLTVFPGIGSLGKGQRSYDIP
jgi:hypothetical protein